MSDYICREALEAAQNYSAKVQALINVMAEHRLLPEGAWTFPDGESWRPTETRETQWGVRYSDGGESWYGTREYRARDRVADDPSRVLLRREGVFGTVQQAL